MRPLSATVRRLLAAALGEGGADALGDLDEEYHERIAPTRPWWRAEAWYLLEAASLFAGEARLRLHEATRSERRSERRETWGTRRTMGRLRGDEGMMGSMMWDVRDALRALRGAPGSTFVIVMTLAVCLGATTATFALTHSVFLRPFPYPGAERVHHLYTGTRGEPETLLAVSPADLADVAATDGLVEAVAAWSVGESVHMTTGSEPLRLEAPRITEDVFAFLGLEPIQGRFFVDEEFVPGLDDAVVLSEGLWERAFGRDPAVVGTAIEIDGVRRRVVGVAPAEGALPLGTDLWRPLALGPEWYEDGRWGWQFLKAMVRLTPEGTESRPVETLNRRLAEVVPDRVERGQTRVLRSLLDERAADRGRAILLLLSAVACVLLLACVNLITVAMVRAEARVREYGLRRALGSGAGALARAAIVEALIVGALGGALGLVLADRTLVALERIGLEALAALGPLRIDPGVFVFTAAVTLLVVLAMAVAPVLLALRSDPRRVLTSAGGHMGSGRRIASLRDGLVVLQISLATALLVNVGVAASAFRGLAGGDPGFQPEGVLSMTVELPSELADGPEGSDAFRRLIERIESLPGVRSASVANFLPLEGVGWSASFDLVDPVETVAELNPAANMRAVGPDYFETMGIALEEGRSFTMADGPDAPPVVIVDRAVADRYWPGGSPVGERTVVPALSRDEAVVVGVVDNVPVEELGDLGDGHVYFPVLQRALRRVAVVARVQGDPSAIAGDVRAAARDVEARMPVLEVISMPERVAGSYAGFRLGVLLLSAFGLAGVTLAGLGVYGVLAQNVGRRRAEIALRVALGASPRIVLSSVLRRSLLLWAGGALAGLTLAWATRGWLERALDGGAPGLLTWTVVAAAGLGVVALLSAVIPASRALRLDPASTLRA